MSGSIKKCFFATMMFFGRNLSNVNSLKSVSMNNQECKVRPEIVNINSNEPIFFPFSTKCSGSCSNINLHMQNHVFLMLLKTLISKFLI